MLKNNELATQETLLAPWEKAFANVLTPLEEFIHKETSSGILLMLFTVIALVLANSPWHDAYHAFFHTQIKLNIGTWLTFDDTLHHWINDGLMTLFFLVVGLEIKREILVGELSKLKQALLPIAAALGGMIAPAAIYVMLNYGGSGISGWGIPMATDIAFAVGVLVLLGTRIPHAIITFLLALAIVDDLGAVIVIALFYTESINLTALSLAGMFSSLLLVCNRAGIRHPLPYFIVGTLLWVTLLKSGIHATLAGIMIALSIPSRTRINSQRFKQHVLGLMDKFDQCKEANVDLMHNPCQTHIVNNLEQGANAVVPLLQRLERNFHLPVAFIIIPLFALANAGVPINANELMIVLSTPVTLGVILGLVIGKCIGIVTAVWLLVKSGFGSLPPGVNYKHIIGVGLLGGIGFTMSIFIAELAFEHAPDALLMAKTGVLIGSLIAGTLGYSWLRLVTLKPH